MKRNPFTELKYSDYSDKEYLNRIAEIKEIDRRLEFLNNIKIGNHDKLQKIPPFISRCGHLIGKSGESKHLIPD